MPSCWTCAHQQIGGDTFLGLCRWFETQGKPKKPIPPDVVDVGCKFFEHDPTRYWATHELERPFTGKIEVEDAQAVRSDEGQVCEGGKGG